MGAREERYRKKFEAGRNYIPALFQGLILPDKIEQIALFVYGGGKQRLLAGGEVVFIKEFMLNILNGIRAQRVSSAAIPEEYPLLRTLQFAAQYWGHSKRDIASAVR